MNTLSNTDAGAPGSARSNVRWMKQVATVAAATLLMGSMVSGAAAQSASGRAPIQLAFGYECGDRFLVRNDGGAPVDIEYGLQGAEQRTSLHINAAESIEIASASNGPMEL